jgi:hypothetical protein
VQLVAVPSQVPAQAVPSVAQGGRMPCGAPAIVSHVPSSPGTLHAWHWPVQGLEQHTPSTQYDDSH